MGTFANTLLGNGKILYDSVDIGFLQGPSKFSWKPTILKFECGDYASPIKLLRGQDITKVECSLTAAVAEFTADSVSMMMGGLTVTDVAGTEVTPTAHLFTMAPCPFATGVDYVVLAGPNISTGADAPVVKDITEVTTYVENDDYIVDYDYGYIFRNPGGSIGATDPLHIAYKYTPPASKQIKLGTSFSLAQKEVEFVMKRRTGKEISFKLWLASTSGECEFDFDEEKYFVNNCVFNGVYDAAHADSPMGLIDLQI